MEIQAYSYTSQGGREHNEDHLRCLHQKGKGIFVLADGLGGHLGGGEASKLAVDVISRGCIHTPPDCALMLEFFIRANESILDRQRVPAYANMKTTAVSLVIEEGYAVFAHVGDSRLYHFSGGRVWQLTQDHSVTFRKYLGGEISYMDINHDDDRSSLLRVLGKQNCIPEVSELQPKAGDGFLLCSDGFWEYVYKEEMLIDWLKSETPEQWAQAMLVRLIRRIPPGNDNISLITVRLEDTL